MKSSFLSTLVAVLSGKQEIAELPNDKLVAFDCEGEALEGEVPIDFLLKIARLQTLSVQARKNAEMPSFEAIQQIAKETNVLFVVAAANAAGVHEDAVHCMMMIERLIVEAVREVYPAEYGQFDVQYSVHINRKIIRRPINKRFHDSTW
ncbi:MAG: hypothetical protein WCV55_02095 [Candidatus Paceibacterota bacterium]